MRNQSRRHGKKVWFNRECELLRKECMTIKNSLKHVYNPQYQLFHEHVKQYKNIVSKTKKIYTRKFHSNIRKPKTKNPRELWNVIKTETNTKHSQFNDTLFVDHFRKINSDPLFSGTVPLLYDPAITQENEAINRPFSLEEVKLEIRKLKNNKASGVDNVINEFFKHCHNYCIHIIVDCLNIVLNTGFIPTEWCIGIIHPLFKNKGSVLHITLLSCTGKLFTACLNCRLSCYVDVHILGQEQAGFRESYSTIDHIFVLQLIVELYQSVHKRVYCVLIDYRKPQSI